MEPLMNPFHILHLDNDDNELIWTQLLNDQKVQSVLWAFMKYRKIYPFDTTGQLNNQVLEKLSDETGFNIDYIYQQLTLGAISSLQLYVVDNFLCFIDTSEEFNSYRDCLQFVKSLFEIEKPDDGKICNTIDYYCLTVNGENMYSVGIKFFLLNLIYIRLNN